MPWQGMCAIGGERLGPALICKTLRYVASFQVQINCALQSSPSLLITLLSIDPAFHRRSKYFRSLLGTHLYVIHLYINVSTLYNKVNL